MSLITPEGKAVILVHVPQNRHLRSALPVPYETGRNQYLDHRNQRDQFKKIAGMREIYGG